MTETGDVIVNVDVQGIIDALSPLDDMQAIMIQVESIAETQETVIQVLAGIILFLGLIFGAIMIWSMFSRWK